MAVAQTITASNTQVTPRTQALTFISATNTQTDGGTSTAELSQVEIDYTPLVLVAIQLTGQIEGACPTHKEKI